MKYIFQPFCLDLVRSSSRVTNSKSSPASSRRGGKPGESDSDGSAQSVHSRAILKLPRSKSRRISMSLPARRRFLSTSNRWPRNGWKGWRISTHPKGELGSSAVRTDRPNRVGSVNPTGGAAGFAKAVGPDVFRWQLWIPAGTVAAWSGSPSTEVPCGRLWLGRWFLFGEIFRSGQSRQTHGADRQTGTGQAAVKTHPGNAERRGDGGRAGETERGRNPARGTAYSLNAKGNFVFERTLIYRHK